MDDTYHCQTDLILQLQIDIIISRKHIVHVCKECGEIDIVSGPRVCGGSITFLPHEWDGEGCEASAFIMCHIFLDQVDVQCTRQDTSEYGHQIASVLANI